MRPNLEGTDTNLTVAFEAAPTYGRNVSTLPEMESFPIFFPFVVSMDFLSYHYRFLRTFYFSFQFEYPGGHPFIRKTASDFGWDWVSQLSTVFRIAYICSL